MIISFACRETERLFRRGRTKRFPPEVHVVALRKLRMLHRAAVLSDLRNPPANRLERLWGSRAGQHSIRINRQWRVCFTWRADGARDVEIVDDH